MTITRARAAQLRMEGGRYEGRASRPSERRFAADADAPSASRLTLGPTALRAASGSTALSHVFGLASVTEVGYEMWDWAGPYTEIVALEAFDATLAADPLVEFTLNHNRGGGLPMAHTRNGTLTLTAVKDADPTGLEFDADVDPTRYDVSDMLKALARGDLAEASFKFRIVRGQWSPDYTEYRINEVDLHRGDVSAVNFGANPAATSGARALQPPAPAAPRVRISDEDVAVRTLLGL